MQKRPDRVLVYHVHFETCFPPQLRAVFEDLNFQKRSQAEVF